MMLGVIVGNLMLIARDKASLQTVNWLFKRPSAIKNQGYSYHPNQLQPNHQEVYHVALSSRYCFSTSLHGIEFDNRWLFVPSLLAVILGLFAVILLVVITTCAPAHFLAVAH